MFNIDHHSSTPIYRQIIQQLKFMVLTDAISSTINLPSVRSVAKSLSINANTIQKAYNQLKVEGIIITIPGTGRHISTKAKSIIVDQICDSMGEIYDCFFKLALAGIKQETLQKNLELAYKNALECRSKIVK